MPGGDRTGPAGAGPMTGRGAGYCAGYAVPGYMNPAGGRSYFGMGRGGGRGGGWGRRNMYYATGLTGRQRFGGGYPAYGGGPYGAPSAPPISKEQELNMLKDQAEYLKSSLNELDKRIEELEGQAQQK